MATYAAECEKQLGAPFPDDVNCIVDGTEVPITVRGGTPLVFKAGVVDDAHPITACDRPALLPFENGAVGQCVPHSRIIRRTAKDKDGHDVVTQIFCRRYHYRAADDETFDDINAIRYNTTTNKSCWFNSELPPPAPDPKIKSPKIPDPTKGAGTFWKQPSSIATGAAKCQRCHDNDIWIHTPYVEQLSKDKNAVLAGSRLTNDNVKSPRGTVPGGVPPKQMTFRKAQLTNILVDAATTKEAKDALKTGINNGTLASPALCTGCHSIADPKTAVDGTVLDRVSRTCAVLGGQSTATVATPNLRPIDQDKTLVDAIKKDSGTLLSEMMRTHWMPAFPTKFATSVTTDINAIAAKIKDGTTAPNDGVAAANASYLKFYQTAIDGFRQCCTNPDLKDGTTPACR